MVRRREDQRTRFEHMRKCAGIILRVGFDLRKSDIAGRVDEFAEVSVRHRCPVYPEGVNRNPVDRPFFRVVTIRSHAEGAAGNTNHILKMRPRGR